jgi:hypothetical protein
MKHEMTVIDEETIGCTCGKWSRKIKYETTDKQMTAWHDSHKKKNT